MRTKTHSVLKWGLLGTAAAILLPAVALVFNHSPAAAQQGAPCVTQKDDPVGCQPAPFNVLPLLIPSRRIDEKGNLNPMATEEQVRAGAKLVEQQLGLMRNFDHLLWVPYNASSKNAAGAWAGGDLDAVGDGRALTIAGNCIFMGHANGGGGERPMEIYRLADNAAQQIGRAHV